MTDMKDVDHTRPETVDSFGDAFRRGPDVAADGGERETATDESSETNEESGATMDQVDHTPTEGVSRSFERGTEGRSDTV